MNSAMNAARCTTFLLFAILPTMASAADSTVCHDEGRYRVVARPTGSVGTDFLVKYTGHGRNDSPCLYAALSGDFEIRNENAEYLLALQPPLLILDSGTAPEPRGLIVWDLDQRRKVYSGSYSPPYSIDREGMRFWIQSGPGTDADCPQAAEWRAKGLGTAVETEVRLVFADYRVVQSEAIRCSARQ